MKYYLVIAKCGHVGKGKYVEVEFPVYAIDKHSASQMCLRKGKVKKHLKNAISSIYEITYEEYLKRLDVYKENQFVKAHTKKEIVDYIESAQKLESDRKGYKNSFKSRSERVLYLLKRNKIMEDLIYA